MYGYKRDICMFPFLSQCFRGPVLAEKGCEGWDGSVILVYEDLFVIWSGPGANCMRPLCYAHLTSHSLVHLSNSWFASPLYGEIGSGDAPGKYVSLI